MAAKVTIEMSVRDFKSMAEFLKQHEWEIADELGDFDELRGLFLAVYEEDPKDN